MLRAALAAACTVWVTVAAAPARGEVADAGASSATMTCDPVVAPGRVRCEVEARVPPDESITWGDVVLVAMPPFATALRGRIGPHDASLREDTRWRWALALVANERGEGDVRGRVRLVVCRGKACAPRELEFVGRVMVGREP